MCFFGFAVIKKKKKHQMICLNLKVQGQASELLHKSWLL